MPWMPWMYSPPRPSSQCAETGRPALGRRPTGLGMAVQAVPLAQTGRLRCRGKGLSQGKAPCRLLARWRAPWAPNERLLLGIHGPTEGRMHGRQLSASDKWGREEARRAVSHKTLGAGLVIRSDPEGLLQAPCQGHLSHARTHADCHAGPVLFLYEREGSSHSSDRSTGIMLWPSPLTEACRFERSAPERGPRRASPQTAHGRNDQSPARVPSAISRIFRAGRRCLFFPAGVLF
jgi:hypothetical protein